MAPMRLRSSPSGALRRGAILLGIAALALLADQASKAWVQQHFALCDDSPAQTIVPQWLSFIYTCNRGAAFGLLANATLLFVLIALLVIVAIIAYVRYLPANRPWLRLSLGLQLGGALGNLIDRVRQGFVVDFISVKSFPVFNVADSCIVIGVVILAYYLLIAHPPPPATVPAPVSERDEATAGTGTDAMALPARPEQTR